MRFCLFSAFVLIISLSVISCQREIDPYSPPVTDSTGNGSDSTIDDSASVDSYQPLTTGSWWKYKDSASGSEYTSTIGGFTKVINNITHKAYLSNDGTTTDTLWIAAPRPNYYLVAQGISPNTSLPYDLTFYYLNDTASVGYSWQYTAGSGGGFTALGKSTIVAKDLTLQVEGKTYTDVTQTSLDLSYDIFGTVINYGTYNYFMAKGIGFIKIRTDIYDPNGGATLSTCTNLVDYEIK